MIDLMQAFNLIFLIDKSTILKRNKLLLLLLLLFSLNIFINPEHACLGVSMDDSSNGRAAALYLADRVQIPALAPYEITL